MGKRENEVICTPSRQRKANSTLLGTCLTCPESSDSQSRRELVVSASTKGEVCRVGACEPQEVLGPQLLLTYMYIHSYKSLKASGNSQEEGGMS